MDTILTCFVLILFIVWAIYACFISNKTYYWFVSYMRDFNSVGNVTILQKEKHFKIREAEAVISKRNKADNTVILFYKSIPKEEALLKNK